MRGRGSAAFVARLIVRCSVLLLAWGCAAPSQHVQAPPDLRQSAEMLAQAGPPEPPAAYRFGYGDVVEVRFLDPNQAGFNATVTVRPDGRISLLGIDEMAVVGMTPAALDSAITTAYSAVLNEPRVTVFVRQMGIQVLYMLGEVRVPGRVVMEPGMTVLEALAVAGGPTPKAELGNVMLLRRGLPGGIGGVMLDLAPHLKQQGLAAELAMPFVRPHDLIYVPKSKFASVTEFLGQVYSGSMPPLDVYLRLLYVEQLRGR